MSEVTQQNNEKTPRLKFFPVMMFAVIMGFSGITLAYKKAHEILLLPAVIYQVLSYITAALAIIIGVSYLIKIIVYTSEVKKELLHPVRVNFFAAISISMLLLAVVFHEYKSVAYPLFLIGTGLQTFFTFYAITYWLNKNIELAHSNPAWFIPVVGNIIIPIAGEGFADAALLNFFFSWIILTAILFNRIIFHGMLVQKFLPTLAIFIAPPSVGMLSYIKLTGHYDFFASLLLNVAIVFGLILLALIKNFYKLKFFISWWAFTFPMAALTMALITVYEQTEYVYTFYEYLSVVSLIMTSILVLLVLIRTIIAIKNGEICIEE